MNTPDPSRDIPFLFHTCMTKVATEFKVDQSQRKFDLCDQLAAILGESDKSLLSQLQPCSPSVPCSTSPASSSETSASAATWIPLITSGLYDILSSRLDALKRNSAFYLVAALNEVFPGFSWITIGADVNQFPNFFPLIGRLVCIEICIELRKENESIDEQLLNACLMIFENFIDTLCSENKSFKPAQNLPPDSMINLYNSLRETILTVIDYVKSLIHDWESIQTNEKIYSITMACIRIICFWSLEDYAGIEDKMTDLIPFMKNLLQDQKSAEIVGHFISASFDEITDDDDSHRPS